MTKKGKAEVPPGQCTCTALRKATRRLSQLYDTALEPCGLRTTQRAILNHIRRAGTLSLGQLAETLIMDRGALTHNLKPLERDGLVEMRPDAYDRRSRLIGLTQAGRVRLAESELLWAKAQRGFETAFGARESQSLREALAYIVSESFLTDFRKAG